MGKYKIISDGTSLGTSLLNDKGETVPGVIDMIIHCDLNDGVSVIVELIDVEFEIKSTHEIEFKQLITQGD